MKKTTLVALLFLASLYSGLAFSCPDTLSPSRILQVLAALYAPSEPDKNDRFMTFGREHTDTQAQPEAGAVARTFHK
ncbi:MAG TPA: hypothetical protein PLM07_02010 [Candidatus Rifleibacterium sp.]|nr:hypothetical protein [Candidatus Rifleibacterium sp.]HPT44655.1 hypothetical protein [Candidatus Rifleibacterium sp.]